MITRSIAKILLQENAYKPIAGRLLTLGPQFVFLTREQVDDLFSGKCSDREIGPPARSVRQDVKYATEEYFFKKFGIDQLDSIDVNHDYGATIVHDLNRPVPESLVGQFDFIVDGGTFDHLVHLGVAFENVVKMLKPGGRILHWNAASNYVGAAYLSFGPDLFYDYYVLNGFADCKVYLAREVSPAKGGWDLIYIKGGICKIPSSKKRQMTIVLAEKGEVSRWDRMPVERCYQSPEYGEMFRSMEQCLAKSERPLFKGHVGLREQAKETCSYLVRKVLRIRWRLRKGDFKFSRKYLWKLLKIKPKEWHYRNSYLGRI